MSDLFEWDPNKASSNFRKHGVSFQEATSIFGDPLSITISDRKHSDIEDRFLITGYSNAGRQIVVSHAFRNGTIRIISARIATPAERRNYERNR